MTTNGGILSKLSPCRNKVLLHFTGVAAAIAGIVLMLVSNSFLGVAAGFILFIAGGVLGIAYSKAQAIARRELASYFTSPVAYILMAAYLFVVAFVFNMTLERAYMEQVFGTIGFLSLLVCPVITMRLISEEARSGTLETMLTVPVSDLEIALGKYFGAFVFFLILQAPTLVFVYILSRHGSPDYGAIFSGYAGVALFGAMLVSLGLLISSLTKNQVIAAFTSTVIMFVLFIGGMMARNVSGTAGKVLQYIGTESHYQDFINGVINSQHVVYFLTLTAFFLFLAVRSIESHRWR